MLPAGHTHVIVGRNSLRHFILLGRLSRCGSCSDHDRSIALKCSVRRTIKMIKFLMAFLFVMTLHGNAYTHPGRTNSEGCHNDRSNGTYHCHNSGRAAPSRPIPSASNAPIRPSVSGDVYYRNCTEARAAGAAPVRRGQPGYGAHLDRDNDGIGCE